MIMIDSGIWIDYFNGQKSVETDYLDEILGIRPIATGDLIITEVLQGFKTDKEYKTAKRLFETLQYHDLLGHSIAIKGAENYRILRKKGVTIRKTIDTLIATFCIENEMPLLFVDKDFLPFVNELGLKTVFKT